LDVEGLPDREFHYLIGVVVDTGATCSTHSFWADDEADEQTIWSSLLELLQSLGDYTLFHYGSYEQTYLSRMRRRSSLSDGPLPEESVPASINVLGAIRTNVYFPVYSNGLKDVATYLGAAWAGPINSGIDCIARRLRWEVSRDERTKTEIIQYNQE